MNMKRWVLTCLIFAFGGSTVLLSGCSDSETVTKSWAENNIPREAEIIEHLPAVAETSRQAPRTYIIYKFRGQCILMFYGYRRLAHTTINCPADENPK